MKLCTKCGIKKDESEFCKNKSKKSGLSSHCKLCHRQVYYNYKNTIPNYNHNNYMKNLKNIKQRSGSSLFKMKRREKYPFSRTEKEKLRRITLRQKWLEILNKLYLTKCKICGYDKCFDAIDFHHPDPLSKDSNIGRILARVPTEERINKIKVCIPLCCRCHRELHANIIPPIV